MGDAVRRLSGARRARTQPPRQPWQLIRRRRRRRERLRRQLRRRNSAAARALPAREARRHPPPPLLETATRRTPQSRGRPNRHNGHSGRALYTGRRAALAQTATRGGCGGRRHPPPCRGRREGRRRGVVEAAAAAAADPLHTTDGRGEGGDRRAGSPPPAPPPPPACTRAPEITALAQPLRVAQRERPPSRALRVNQRHRAEGGTRQGARSGTAGDGAHRWRRPHVDRAVRR